MRSKYYAVSDVCSLKIVFDFADLEWNTFATYHGKAAVDGVGGSSKNTFWINGRTDELNIDSAKEYYDIVNVSCKE